MLINFQQGIITYPTSAGQQTFLAKTGSYVSLQTANGRTDVTFAHGSENYLYTESSDVANAWGPLLPSVDYWLYWDLDLLTAARTFGFTTIQPIYSPIEPDQIQGQHWFNTIEKQMYFYQSGGWRKVVRVFAAKIHDAVFSGLGVVNSPLPFAGSQAGLATPGITTGRIIVDNTGTPIRRASGLFFTTEDDIFVNGSPVNVIRLEANIVNATAQEYIARYQVVKYTGFGKIHLASYNDTQETVIAMSMEDLLINQAGTLCVQGVITNPLWNFQTVGAALWIADNGLLTEIDPHLVNPLAHEFAKVPVARVLTPTSIFFDQGMGGKGSDGKVTADIPLATDTIFGITKLSVPAVNAANPIAVGDNDPRLIPYVHPSTHPATMITTGAYGFLTGLNAQVQLNQLVDRTLDTISDVTAPTPATNDYLKWNGTNWVNAPVNVPTYAFPYLDQVLDVTAPTPATNDYLKWNGTNWVNAPVNTTVAQLELEPIVITNLMSDSLTDAPILIPGHGATVDWNSGKTWFGSTYLLNFGLITQPLLFEIVISDLPHTITISNPSTLITYADLINRLNVELAGIATVTLSSIAASSQIIFTTVVTGHQVTTRLSNTSLRAALVANAMGAWDLTNGVATNGSDNTYDNYVDEYYIIGNLPANIPAVAPVFTVQFGSNITPATVLGWGAVVPSFKYNLSYDSRVYNSGEIIMNATVDGPTTLGAFKTYVESHSPLLVNINTVLNQLSITYTLDSPYTIGDAPSLTISDFHGYYSRSAMTYAPYSVVGLTASTTPTIGSNDSGAWTISLPFPVLYNNLLYTAVNVSTDSFLSFDLNTHVFYTSNITSVDVIQLGASDRSAQRIYYGAEGTAPNRTFRIIFEGHTTWSGGVLGSPTLSWEVTFHEANNSSFDIQIGATDGLGSYEAGGSTTYLFSIPSAPNSKYNIIPDATHVPVWNIQTGAFKLFTDTLYTTQNIVGNKIFGTSTVFQPGIWARSALPAGDLIVYNKNGKWASLGNADDVLNGKRVGIALAPQSGRLASGTFAGKDGQIARYTK